MAADGSPAGLKNNQAEIKPAPSRRPSGRGGRREGAGRKPGAQSKSTIDGRLLAQEYGPAAIRKAAELAGLILEVVPNKEGDGEMEVPIGQAASEAVRVSALNIIIERAFGKAAQPLNHGDNDGGKLQPTINFTRGVGPAE